MKVLFICKYNRFRSKVAEAIFNKFSLDKSESAGLFMDKEHPYIEESVLNLMKEKGYFLFGKPRKVNKKIIERTDLVVIVADNVDESLFSSFGKKVIKWDISDCDASNFNCIRNSINEIERRVKSLLSS